MNTSDHIKLLKAGFTIIRADNTPRIRIKKLSPGSGNPSWVTYRNFETKASRDREMKRMLEDDMTISD